MEKVTKALFLFCETIASKCKIQQQIIQYIVSCLTHESIVFFCSVWLVTLLFSSVSSFVIT